MSARVYAMRVSSCRPRRVRLRVDYIVRYFLARRKDRPFSTYRACAYSSALYSSKYSHCTFIREPSAVTWRAGRARKGMRAPEFASYSRQTEKQLSRIIFENIGWKEVSASFGHLKTTNELARVRLYWVKKWWKLTRCAKSRRSHLLLRKQVAYLLKRGMRHDHICR